MVALSKKPKGGLSFGRQKMIKEQKKTTQEKTPRVSNSKKFWPRGARCDDESSVSSDSSDDDDSREDASLEKVQEENCKGFSFDSGVEEDEHTLTRCGTSWDDEDQFENAFFEKSIKDETQQALVKVLEHGNVEKLILEANSFIPKCSEPDDVVIKVNCSTITLQDCMVRRGKWIESEMNSLPYTPGTDIVGTIYELGSSELESRLQVGNLVAAVISSGGSAKFAKVKASEILPVPKGVDPVMALCISSTYVPAKQSLEVTRAAGTPLTGANVLVIGASGPNGLATIDLATMEGANVFAIADENHHEYLLSIGVKECFPVNPQKWLPRLGGKMDVVIDSVCFDGYESSAKALAPKGKLVCTGMSATFTQGRIDWGLGFGDFRGLTASYQKAKVKYTMHNTFYYDKVESFKGTKAIYDQYFKYLCHIHKKGQLKPTVGSFASLTMVSSSQQAIERGDAPYGVIVTKPWITREDFQT